MVGVFVKPDRLLGEIYQISIVLTFVEAASDLNQTVVGAHLLLIGNTGEYAADDEGWDYGEHAATSDDSWIIRTHGGLSGSAVWLRIDLPVGGSARIAVVLDSFSLPKVVRMTED